MITFCWRSKKLDALVLITLDLDDGSQIVKEVGTTYKTVRLQLIHVLATADFLSAQLRTIVI